MKEIATSQCDFAALREGDKCVYADKTDILAKLALRQDVHYFISRPRRFGMSPMLNMSDVCAETPEDVKDALHDLAEDIAVQHGLEVRSARSVSGGTRSPTGLTPSPSSASSSIRRSKTSMSRSSRRYNRRGGCDHE